MRSMSMPVSASMRRFLPRLTYTGWHRTSRGRTWRSTGPGSPPSCWRCSGRRRRMAETLWRCEAHGSDWYRDWCVMTEMARREGHRVVDLDPCRPVEGVWSAPGELVDPADLDYEAAMRPLDKFL